jgi:type I restriction enzyme R subunit
VAVINAVYGAPARLAALAADIVQHWERRRSQIQGEDVLAQIARELLEVMRRDIKTDWTVRDDVRAKLRSSIKRLLVKHRYPPDKQPEAIRLVIEQMESMAPRYSAERGAA